MLGAGKVFIPIPLTRPRKWMNIRVRAVERRWFDDFGQFCTYALKNAIIDEIVDEEELVWRITKSLRDEEIHPDNIDDIREHIMEVYGIAEEYIDLILQKVRHELRVYEEELVEAYEQKFTEKKFQPLEKRINGAVFKAIMLNVQKMYFELDYDREAIIKEIALSYGLSIDEAREVVGWVESYIFG